MNLYRWLLKLYPAHFREEYGVPMEQQFRDDYRDAETLSQRFALWLSVIWDVATSAPRQLGHEIFLDLKHAVRLYLKRWAATGLAIVALGLAIGVNTGVFSVLNALLLRGLPFAKPAQLTELWGASVSAFQGHNAVKQWAAVSAYLQDATTFSSSEMNLTRERDAYRVNATETSSNFFKLLGVEPAVGRTFGTDEDITGHNAVAVISFSLWQQLYGGNPAIRGTLIHVNGAPFTIIGVAPANFDYPKKTSVWMPTVFDFETIPKRGAFLFETVGRLKEGVTLAVARGLFEAEVQRANPAQFKRVMAAEEQNRPHMTSLQDQLAGPVRQASWVLAGLSLLVLLIACTNVAQLLLSRTAERREELELRAALGASRARLFQQLTTEAACLTVSGAALGLLVAHWTALLASSVAPAPLATQEYSVLDWPVLLFTAVLAILTGVFFGVLPAWLTGRLQAAGQIARSVHRGTKRVRAGFVVLQTAFALCLVTCSFVMGRTFLDLLQADLGFQPANVVTLNVSVQGTRHTGAGEWSYYSEALARLRALPGVTAAGAVGHLPLGHGVYMANTFKLDSGQDTGHTVVNAVTPGYFRAIGTKFLAGGDFAENAGHQPLVIVNEAFAKGTGLGNGIVGRRVIAPWGGPP